MHLSRTVRVHCGAIAGPLLVVSVLFLSSCAVAFAAEPNPSPSPGTSTEESFLVPPLAELSAERAAAERTKTYERGVEFSRWLDRLAKESGRPFLQQRVCGRVTWMRLFASGGLLALLAGLTSLFLWFVRWRAGRIESPEHQTWLALTAAAVRKPFALFACLVGGFFALIPVVEGMEPRSTKLFLAGLLTGILYAGNVIAVFWVLWRGARVVEKKLRQWAERSGSVLNNVLAPVLGQTLRLAVPLLAVILLLPLLKLPAEWAWVTQKGFAMVLIAGLSFLIIRGVRSVQRALLRKHRLDVADNLSARRIYTQVSVIRKIVVAAVVVLSVGSILMLFDPVRQFGTSILASAGIAGVVLGFAAQKTLGNLLAGIQIALTQPFLLDDLVLVEGEYGQIEEITLTYVTVRTWDLRRLVLPITYFVEKPFQNWSRVSTDLLGTVFLHLDYQVPLGELRRELKRLLESNDKWDRKVCALQVTEANERTVQVRAVVSSSSPGKTFDLRCEVREGLIEFIRQHHPGSLPRTRLALERLHEEETRPADASVTRGKEHERGSTEPGVHEEDIPPSKAP